ncbi:MAG: cold shock domain-containing protein [Ktedonobacteraceae bacterium]|nr:cold shock domain-containing protein [Ktedonobacteraceae bacterium]
MTDSGTNYYQADELRKNKQYAEAEIAFRTLWDSHPTANVGWRWALCLRKLGRTEEALKTIMQAAQVFPHDEWLRKEHAWCLYSQEVKPAQEAMDLGRVVRFAQRMVDLAQDPLVIQRAAFSVIKVAKERGKWDVVDYWCRKLDPQQLGAEPQMIGERRSMSEREQWYYAQVKALVHLEQWADARTLALEAAAAFPHKDDFRRWAAQALAETGDPTGAVGELEVLIRRNNAPWYILVDLAQLKFTLGQREEALRLACRSALAFGEDKAKVNLFAFLAEVGLNLNQPTFAALNLALAKAVREREGWPIKQDLVELEQRINASLSSMDPIDIPSGTSQLIRRCQQEWSHQSIAGQTRYTGRVYKLPEGKSFGFIQPDMGGGDIFVRLRDLPRVAQNVGALVEYSLEASFDQVKNRDSVQAVSVRLVSKPAFNQVASYSTSEKEVEWG